MSLTRAGKQHKLENLLKEPGVQEYTVYLEATVQSDCIENAIKVGEHMTIGYGVAHSVTMTHIHVYMGNKRLATAKFPEDIPF